MLRIGVLAGLLALAWAIPASAQETIDQWAETTPLPDGVSVVGGAVAHGDHLIFATNDRRVLVADLATDGHVLGWRETLSIPNHDFSPYSLVRIDEYLVVPTWDKTFVGHLAPDASILFWDEQPGGVNPDNHGRAVVADGNRIYSIGGKSWRDGNQLYRHVEMTTLGPGGTITAWESLISLPADRHDPEAIIAGGYLYVFGGERGSSGDTSVSRDVLRAPLLPDGSIGAWEFVGLLLEPRPHHGIIDFGDTVHLVGGGLGDYVNGTVESVLRTEIGQTARHVYSAPIGAGRWRVVTAASEQFGYVFGGTGPRGNPPYRSVLFTGLQTCTFGPEDQPYVVTRSTGKPVTETLNWASCGGTGTLRVRSDGVQSAVVTLNGAEILMPSDFNNHAFSRAIEIELAPGDNVLEVTLRGKPGRSLVIEIVE